MKKAVFFVPNNDFFSGEGFDQGPVKNGPAPGNADDGSLDDAFAGMQKLDLFDEEPSAPETGAPGVTQLFEPVGGQPAAPQKNIGEMVFGDVFGPQADGAAQPAGPDAASAPVEIPLETVGVPGAPEPLVQEITFDDEPEAQPAAPQQAAAPQQPAAAAPAGEAHRFPEDPMPKRSPAKPIDWNADLLSRKRPAAAPVPVQAAPAQAAAPTGDPCLEAAFGQRGERHPGRHRGHQSVRPRARGPARCAAAACGPRRGRGRFLFGGAAAQAGHQRGGADGPRAVRF